MERPRLRGEAHPEPEHAAVGGGGRLDLRHLLARVRGGQEVLAPLFHPLHRAAQEARDRGDREVLGEDVELLAKAPADVRHDDAHAVRRQSEVGGERLAQEVRRLGARPDLETQGLRPAGDESARLDGGGGAAGVAEGLAHDVGGPGEGPVEITGGVLRVEEHLSRGRRQRRVGHGDPLPRVRGQVGRRRGHRGDGLAGKAHPAVGEGRPFGRPEARGLEPGRERPHALAKLRRGHDGGDAGECQSLAGVDPLDARVGVRTPDEGEGAELRQAEVVEVATGTGQEPRVLDPPDRSTDVPQAGPRRPAARAAPGPR